MSISVARQLGHELVMTHQAIPQRPPRTAATLGLGFMKVAVLAAGFHLAARVGDAGGWSAVLALCAVARLVILVALTRALWRLGAVCLRTFTVASRSGSRTEILGEDSPI